MTPSRVERRLGEIVDDHNGRVADERLRGLDDPAKPVYVISVAAELAGMHAQTLRQYDRLGLVTPERTSGGGRRYSMRDIAQLRQVQELSSDTGERDASWSSSTGSWRCGRGSRS